jgi:Uma2 family endonuclease
MLDNTLIMGVNAPKEHQRVITKLTAELYFLYKKGAIPYEPLPETMIDESKTSPTPDVLLFDNATEKNIVIVEVTIPASEKDDFNKIRELLERYEVPEGFTYNYRTGKWRRCVLGVGEITDNPSFCTAIQLDLNDLLKK